VNVSFHPIPSAVKWRPDRESAAGAAGANSERLNRDSSVAAAAAEPLEWKAHAHDVVRRAEVARCGVKHRAEGWSFTSPESSAVATSGRMGPWHKNGHR
jgi:hypothetical protein